MSSTTTAYYNKPHQTTATAKASRIELIDALRGFAIFAIMLLHNLEHFDFYYFPKDLPAWIKTMDSKVWDTFFFLFAGKAYAIFALLFGFTFFIQMNNQQKKGADFRLRFLWRLFLLLIFAFFNSLFYEGDILSFYAVLGVMLIPVSKWSNKAVLITAIILMLQPVEWINVIHILNTPGYVAPPNMSDQYFAKAGEYISDNSFWNLIKGNLLNGKPAVFFWYWEAGRFFQTPSLFMLGMLLGRQSRLQNMQQNAPFWRKTLLIAAISFAVLFYLKGSVHEWLASKPLAGKLSMIITTWSNFAFMLVLVSLFVFLYAKSASQRVLNIFSPLGRMSLTNYIAQSIMGTFVYYGYGLGLYKYTGATYCLLIGLLLFTLQLFFCRWWLSRHKQGPLENLWHRATWI
jgi:uncharacterized protein